MSAVPFAGFFSEATGTDPKDPASGQAPFRWQERAAAELAAGRIPAVIDVPTGFGKTSVILAWAHALAEQARSGEPRTLPLRLCFVVDRRLVVDGAYREADRLACRLHEARDGEGPLPEVARSLLSLFEGEKRPLEVTRMRGGVTWESRWLARPDQPAVVVGTVDQFGSRLLFRGYRTSERMRPLDAALVGLDSWLVIDEAHIAAPLGQTATSVAAYQRLGRGVGVPTLQVTRMSATVGAAEGALRADLEEETDEARAPDTVDVARRRGYAEKQAALIDLPSLVAGGRGSWRARGAELGVALADLARAAAGDARLVSVVANTIRTARAAHERLERRGEQAILLTGRCREYERDQLLDDWYRHVEVGSPRTYTGRLFLVATQTIEVGVNLDADLLVTEAAPLPSLVQRFGRVNRVGDLKGRTSLVVHAPFAHDEDPIYGDATRATWVWLRDQVGEVVEVDPKRVPAELDLGKGRWKLSPAELREFTDAAPVGLVPAEPLTPVLLGAHLERWAATCPAPWPDADVAPFLHGVERGAPEVAVAWRAAPPPSSEKDAAAVAWREWLALLRPVDWEFVEVPVWEARALLDGTVPSGPTSDLESLPEAGDRRPEADEAGGEVLGVLLHGDADPVPLRRPGQVSPGDRVVLRSDLGGHDRWGWTGQRGDPVPDVADLAVTRRSAPALRLSWRVSATWLPEREADLRSALVAARSEAEGTDGWQDVLGAWLNVGVPEPLANRYREALAGSRPRPADPDGRGEWRATVTPVVDEAGVAVLLLSAPSRWRGLDAVVDDEAGTSQTSTEPYPLARHGRGVGALAKEFACHLGLPPALAGAVALAGRLHDLGKADRRFQVMLHDGDRLAAAAADAPLAKSGRDPRDPVARAASRLSRLPRGFRHEAVSGRLVRQLLAERPELAEGLDADVVHHLVVSHHGRARPLLPPVLDPGAGGVEVESDGHRVRVEPAASQVDWSHPARFERLGLQYGWWGLALLEALVRLADMRCSEEGH